MENTVRELQLRLIREATPEKRTSLMAGWSETLLLSAFAQVKSQNKTHRESIEQFLRVQYGNDFVEKYSPLLWA